MTLRLLFIAFLAAGLGAGAAEPARWSKEGWATDFSKSAVPFSEILDGGPPRDGIPAIDAPRFEPASTVDIDGREPVIVHPLDENARAYPLRVLMWHEIVNDEVDGVPVAVTYCPLCNASVVFDRRVDGRVLDFGTSGKLRHSDLVMYDRQTETWWQQFTGQAIVGALTGRELAMLPSRVMPFEVFVKDYPQAPVLVPENANSRPYGSNPYVGYDTGARPYGFFVGPPPEGMPAMAHVVLARGPDGPAAVSMAALAAAGTLEHGGLTFRWRPGQASALDEGTIAAGRDLGFVEVTDAAGTPVVHDVTFAFALNAFEPDIVVLTAKGPIRLSDGAPAGEDG